MLTLTLTGRAVPARPRRTQDEGDGDLLRVFIEVQGELLKQPLLVVQQDDPAEHSRGYRSGTTRHTSPEPEPEPPPDGGTFWFLADGLWELTLRYSGH